MESKIIVCMFKNGVEVSRSQPLAHVEAHPDVLDFLGDLVSEIADLSFSSVVKFGLAGLAGAVWSPLGALATIEAARSTVSNAQDAITRITDASNTGSRRDAEYALKESDDFDEIRILYYGWSEDEIKFGEPIYYEPGRIIDQAKEKHRYNCTISLNSRKLEEGHYTFAFGSVDDGWHYDVAAISTLVLTWQKRPKKHCTGMRTANLNIDPPAPPHALRSLRQLGALLDFCSANKKGISLRRCCEVLNSSKSVQDAPLDVYGQNMALFPDNLEIPIAGYGVPVKRLYEGKNRARAIDSLIDYVKEEKPAIVGLSEVWVPEERSLIRQRLSDIYPVDKDSFFAVEGPTGDPPGFNHIPVLPPGCLGGGLMLLSQYPIMERNQIIFHACQGEDCLAIKGVLHAGIMLPGFSSLIHVFLTHTQSCPPETDWLPGNGPDVDCETKQMQEQMGALVRLMSEVSRDEPCILMGDWNIDALDLVRYSQLNSLIPNGTDSWLASPDHGMIRSYPGVATKRTLWEKDKLQENGYHRGVTNGGVRNFKKDATPKRWDDKERMKSGARIDYVIGSPCNLITFSRSDIVMLMQTADTDASDHYGVQSRIGAVRTLK